MGRLGINGNLVFAVLLVARLETGVPVIWVDPCLSVNRDREFGCFCIHCHVLPAFAGDAVAERCSVVIYPGDYVEAACPLLGEVEGNLIVLVLDFQSLSRL